MKKYLSIVLLHIFSLSMQSQTGFEITINLKNCRDTIAYLSYYQFDNTYVKDSCTQIKNGKIIFKGNNKLPTGIYSLVSQDKVIYFDFIIDEGIQNLDLIGTAETSIYNNIRATNSDIENDFFDYIKFVINQNEDLKKAKQKLNNLMPLDSTADFTAKQKDLDLALNQYELQLYRKRKGSYLADVLNLKIEKTYQTTDRLLAQKYYQDHYWDNVDFKDDATIRNPFFFHKLNNYFDNIVTRNTDSIIVAIDAMLSKTISKGLIRKQLLYHFIFTYANSISMGHDKVFVHIVDTYLNNKENTDLYDIELVEQIIKHSEKLRPQLIGSKAPNLFLINATDIQEITKMGFESAQTTDEFSKLQLQNKDRLNVLFNSLNDVKADNILLVFWDVDCDHCKVELPKLLEAYHKFQREGKDVKVYCIYMKYNTTDYLKFINDNKLDWINVYDGVRNNEIYEKYGISYAPVVYLLDKNKIIKAKKIGNEFLEILELLEQEFKKGS